MDYAAIRDGLAERLETLDELVAVWPHVPDRAVAPSAAVLPGDPVVTYHRAGEGGTTGLNRVVFDIIVFAGRWDSASGQDVLDGLMTRLPEAVEADQTLGGAAHVVNVLEATNYGTVTVADTAFLGIRYVTEVYAR